MMFPVLAVLADPHEKAGRGEAAQVSPSSVACKSWGISPRSAMFLGGKAVNAAP